MSSQLLLFVVISFHSNPTKGIESKEDACNTLKPFLFDHQSILKKSVNPIYNALQDIEIDYNELLRFGTIDLRDILDESKLSKLHIARLINLLRTVPESQIYKESNRIILTQEEETILESLNTQNMSINSEINQINDTLNQLKRNCSTWKNTVNATFEYLIDLINNEKKLVLQGLHNMETSKTNFFTQLIAAWKSLQNQLTQTNAKIQEILQNKSFEKHERLQHIVGLQHKYMQQYDSSPVTDFKFLSTRNSLENEIEIIIDSYKTVGKNISELNPFSFKFDNIASIKSLLHNNDKTFMTKGLEFDNFACAVIWRSLYGIEGTYEMKLELKSIKHILLGVTSHIKNCERSINPYHYNTGYTYYVDVDHYHAGHGYIAVDKTESVFNNDASVFECKPWKSGDVVTIKLNYNLRSLEYYVNDVFIGRFNNLHPGVEYFPFVSTEEETEEYVLLSMHKTKLDVADSNVQQQKHLPLTFANDSIHMES